jgi:hypothetical protein
MNIELFKGAMKLGGARPDKFSVTISNPVNGVGDIQVPFMCKAARIPTSTIQTFPVKYFGREIQFAGNKTYEDWTVTILNDEDFAIRNAMEEWHNAINSPLGFRALDNASPLLYKSDATVTQFSKTGLPLRIYKFKGIFPATIGEITLDWETGEQIEQFDVTFKVDYYEVVGGVTGNA